MPAPEFRSIAEAKKAKAKELNVGLPIGLENGDLLVVAVVSQPTSEVEGPPTITLPETWTKMTPPGEDGEFPEATNKQSAAIFYIQYAGVSVIPVKSSLEATIIIVAFAIKKGTYNTTTPINIASSWKNVTTAVTTGATPSVTTTVANTLAFACVMGKGIGISEFGWTTTLEGTNSSFWRTTVATASSVGPFTYKKNSAKPTAGMIFAVAPVPEGPSFSESFLETLGLTQAMAGIKKGIASITQTMTTQRVMAGYKTATQASTKHLNSVQTIVGAKSSKGTSTQTTALTQVYAGEHSTGPHFSESFLQTVAFVQSLVGRKSSKAAMAQTLQPKQNFVGQKLAKGSYTQTLQPGQKVIGFKTASQASIKHFNSVQKAFGYKKAKTSITQTLALVQVIPQIAPPAPAALTWLWARIPEPLPYSHTVSPSKPYPHTVGSPQPYPLSVEID